MNELVGIAAALPVTELVDIFLASVRDAYIQVSAFVAITVLAFGFVQYKTQGALVERLRKNERLQPLVGALMGLTPGCGGAIVMMPLYVRGTVSFGTVVATLVATAGDSAFVILALAPEAALYAYGAAFLAAIASGYAIDRWGMGVRRVDAAVDRIAEPVADGGTATGSVVGNRSHEYDDGCSVDEGDGAAFGAVLLAPLTHAVHLLWWLAAVAGLALGVSYLMRGAPEVAYVLGGSFDGLFTVVGTTGTVLSFYLYLVGRRYVGTGHVGRARDSFASLYDTLTHAAMETSFVTVWVVGAYLLYEYPVVLLSLDIQGIAAAAGLLAPVAGAAVGLIPGCGPQIVLAGAYAEGAIPFSALTANAISQDGDALFPLIAIDKKAAVIASIYTTIPGILVGVGIHAVFGPMFGFGVLG